VSDEQKTNEGLKQKPQLSQRIRGVEGGRGRFSIAPDCNEEESCSSPLFDWGRKKGGRVDYFLRGVIAGRGKKKEEEKGDHMGFKCRLGEEKKNDAGKKTHASIRRQGRGKRRKEKKHFSVFDRKGNR